MSVTISGVCDLAGNEALEVAGRALSAGQASVERVAISAAVDARAAEVSSQVGAVGAAGNVTQDLVVALDAKVASSDMVGSLRADATDHVDAKVASLEAVLKPRHSACSGGNPRRRGAAATRRPS